MQLHSGAVTEAFNLGNTYDSGDGGVDIVDVVRVSHAFGKTSDKLY